MRLFSKKDDTVQKDAEAVSVLHIAIKELKGIESRHGYYHTPGFECRMAIDYITKIIGAISVKELEG